MGFFEAVAGGISVASGPFFGIVSVTIINEFTDISKEKIAWEDRKNDVDLDEAILRAVEEAIAYGASCKLRPEGEKPLAQGSQIQRGSGPVESWLDDSPRTQTAWQTIKTGLTFGLTVFGKKYPIAGSIVGGSVAAAGIVGGGFVLGGFLPEGVGVLTAGLSFYGGTLFKTGLDVIAKKRKGELLAIKFRARTLALISRALEHGIHVRFAALPVDGEVIRLNEDDLDADVDARLPDKTTRIILREIVFSALLAEKKARRVGETRLVDDLFFADIPTVADYTRVLDVVTHALYDVTAARNPQFEELRTRVNRLKRSLNEQHVRIEIRGEAHPVPVDRIAAAAGIAAVEGEVRRVVAPAVRVAIGPAVDAAVGPAVDAAVPQAVADAVGLAVDAALPARVLAAVGPAVDAAVPHRVNAAIGPAIAAAVGPAVDAAVPRAGSGGGGPGGPSGGAPTTH